MKIFSTFELDNCKAWTCRRFNSTKRFVENSQNCCHIFRKIFSNEFCHNFDYITLFEEMKKYILDQLKKLVHLKSRFISLEMSSDLHPSFWIREDEHPSVRHWCPPTFSSRWPPGQPGIHSWPQQLNGWSQLSDIKTCIFTFTLSLSTGRWLKLY